MANTNYTFPNQRVIKINREKADRDFLGIKNENWQAAARDLGAHALMLYMYLASNANNYNLALSPAAIQQAIGMPRSTYRDQFCKLVSKGYLIQTGGNTFSFYEVPQTRVVQSNSNAVTLTDYGYNFITDVAIPYTDTTHTGTGRDTEINNREIKNNDGINIEDFGAIGGYIPSPIETNKEAAIPQHGFTF